MRQGHSERFADHLRGGSRAEKLAATAWGSTGAATEIGSLLQREQTMRKASADALNATGVFALFGWKGDAARHEHAGQILDSSQGHHHRGQSFVASGDADYPGALRERADETPKNLRRLVAIRQAVEHAGRALRAAITRVG